MNKILLKGVRVIDPWAEIDLPGTDLLISAGMVAEMGPDLSADADALVLTRPGSILCPAFLDLHCHLREPGQPWKERISWATAAAAAGGFGAVCGMANLAPPVDGVSRLRQCLGENRIFGKIPVLQFASCTLDLQGERPVAVADLARAGAAGFSDDGRNAAGPELLAQVLEQAGAVGRVVAVHPEDERLLAEANRGRPNRPGEWPNRPPEAELAAIESALRALRAVKSGRLHLQHLSTAGAVDSVRRAKAEGLPVTAEVTPHHLALSWERAGGGAQLRCNPPLRTDEDRAALWQGLLEGTIDAVASDHAPHEVSGDDRVQPGFSGIQLVLPAVLGQPGAMAHMPRIVEVLTSGPRGVLGKAADQLTEPGIRVGEPASLTWFDPLQRWSPGPGNWLSLGRNTPFWDQPLTGAALLTFANGRLAFSSATLVAGGQGV